MISSLTDSQETAMRQMACFAYKHSPFYRQLYDKVKIDPENVELPYGLPTVSQSDLVNYSLSFRTDLPAFKICASSGTRTHPKLMFRTEADFEKSVSNQIKLMEWSQVTSTDIVAIVQPFGLWGYGDLTQEATRRMGGMVLPIGNASDEVVLNMMVKIGTTVIDISPSRLRKLLKLVQKLPHNINFNPRIIMVAGEPIPIGLPDQVFDIWGAKIFNHYGSEETDGLGGNRIQNGGIFLFNDDFVFELLNDKGLPVDTNEIGQLVVTSLYHKGTPLIRYKLKDLIRQHPMYPAEIEVLGRAGEYVLLHDSLKFYPYQVEFALNQVSKRYEGWQGIVEDQDSYVSIKMNLLSKEITNTDISQICDELTKCNIDVKALVDRGDLKFEVILNGPLITTQSGKTLRFIDKRVEL